MALRAADEDGGQERGGVRVRVGQDAGAGLELGAARGHAGREAAGCVRMKVRMQVNVNL